MSVPELTQSRDGLLNDKAILDYLKQGSQDEFSSHPVEQANLANEDTKDAESSDDTGMGIRIFSTHSCIFRCLTLLHFGLLMLEIF